MKCLCLWNHANGVPYAIHAVHPNCPVHSLLEKIRRETSNPPKPSPPTTGKG